MAVAAATTTAAQPRRWARPTRRAALTIVTWCLTTASGAGQVAPASDPFAAVAFLVGRWEGTSEGQPGKGTLRREYERVLNGRFIRVRNRSEYPAQEKNPTGELHEDEGYFSLDRGRRKLVLRQFHVEGFVNQYVEDDGATPTRLSFTTEAIENIPPGWRARETYVVLDANTVEEIFELAEAGKSFEVYSRARLRRLP